MQVKLSENENYTVFIDDPYCLKPGDIVVLQNNKGLRDVDGNVIDVPEGTLATISEPTEFPELEAHLARCPDELIAAQFLAVVWASHDYGQVDGFYIAGRFKKLTRDTL